MNVPITFPKSNNILLAVRIGQLGAEFLSDVNLRHSLKRTLLRSGDDDTLLLIYVSGTGNPTQTSLMKEKSYHVRQRSSQNTTLQVMFVKGEVPPRSQSPTHPLLTRTRKTVLVVKQICLYLISSDKVFSERRGKGEV